MAQTYPPPAYRVLAKVEVAASGCWHFTGKINAYGYGKVSLNGRDLMAHRVVYESVKGSIPDGVGLDHICHDPKTCSGGKTCPHRRCVNPDHLVMATAKDNNNSQRSVKQPHRIKKAQSVRNAQQRAITHCKYGHAYTPQNTALWDGHRSCKECLRKRRLEWHAKHYIPTPRRNRNTGKTHCDRGHEFTPENTRVYGGKRQCIACEHIRYKSRYQRAA